jgi:hypothetical protein
MQIGQKYKSQNQAFNDCEVRKIVLIDNEYLVEVIDKEGFNTYTLDLFFQIFKVIN